MNSDNFINYVNEDIDKNKFLNGEFKFGYFRNGVLNFNINKNMFCNFRDFLEKKYKVSEVSQTVYRYYDMYMISNNESSHTCFKYNNPDYKYIKFFEKKNFARFMKKDLIILDPINFPTIENYSELESQQIKTVEIKFKNSIINVNFVTTDDNINFITMNFKVHRNNYDNFKNNLSFILGKFYREKVNL